MLDENKVTIAGYLGADPQLRVTASGTAVCNISVATNKRWKDRDSEEWHTDTQWHRVVIWGPAAKAAADKLSKGSRVRIDGELRTEKWTDAEGIQRETTKIHARKVSFGG